MKKILVICVWIVLQTFSFIVEAGSVLDLFEVKKNYSQPDKVEMIYRFFQENNSLVTSFVKRHNIKEIYVANSTSFKSDVDDSDAKIRLDGDIIGEFSYDQLESQLNIFFKMVDALNRPFMELGIDIEFGFDHTLGDDELSYVEQLNFYLELAKRSKVIARTLKTKGYSKILITNHNGVKGNMFAVDVSKPLEALIELTDGNNRGRLSFLKEKVRVLKSIYGDNLYQYIDGLMAVPSWYAKPNQLERMEKFFKANLDMVLTFILENNIQEICAANSTSFSSDPDRRDAKIQLNASLPQNTTYEEFELYFLSFFDNATIVNQNLLNVGLGIIFNFNYRSYLGEITQKEMIPLLQSIVAKKSEISKKMILMGSRVLALTNHTGQIGHIMAIDVRKGSHDFKDFLSE